MPDSRKVLRNRKQARMKSPIVKRSIMLGGRKTSVSLEDAFWKEVRELARQRHMTLSDLVVAINSERQHGNLSSAIRLFVLDFYRNQVSIERQERDGKMMVWIRRRQHGAQATPDVALR